MPPTMIIHTTNIGTQVQQPIGPIASNITVALHNTIVNINSRERLCCRFERDGSCTNISIMGQMECYMHDPDQTRVIIETSNTRGTGVALESLGYKVLLHPKIDKRLWMSNRSLVLTDSNKGFPSDVAQVILKWEKVGNETDLPIKFYFCATTEAKHTSFHVKVTLNSSSTLSSTTMIKELTIKIPVSAGPPDVVEQINGEWSFDSHAQHLHWHIPFIGQSNNESFQHVAQLSSLKFTTIQNVDDFYPITIDFFSDMTLLSGLIITDVRSVVDEHCVTFSSQNRLEVETIVVK